MRKYFRYFYYYRRGHWTIIVLYAVVLILFMKVLGGFRVGYLRNLDVLYSQILSVCAANAVEYLQLALIAKWKFFAVCNADCRACAYADSGRRRMDRRDAQYICKAVPAARDASDLWEYQPKGTDPQATVARR